MINRILSILKANFFGQMCTLLIQFLGVPLFLHFWGNEVYGEWLIIIAIPAYLTITGTGVGFVVGNKMQMLLTAGQTKEASSLFKSTWAMITGFSALMMAVIIPIMYYLPIGSWLNITHFKGNEVAVTFIILCFYMLLSLQTDLFLAAYRASGKFARGIFLMNLLRLFEFAGIIVSIILGGEVLAAALAYLFVRMLGVTGMLLDLRNVPCFSIGFRNVKFSQIKAEIKPIFTYLAIPLTQVFIIQGMTTVVGIRLGAAAVVIFSLSRTLINLIKQFASIINNAILPEFSSLISSGDFNTARFIHRFAFQITFWFVFICSVGLYLFADWIFYYWTNGEVAFQPKFFLYMLIAAVPNILYIVSSYVPASINKFSTQSVTCLLSAILCIVITYSFAPQLGLLAIPLALFISESIILYFILNQSLKILKDSVQGFFLHLFSSLPFKHLLNAGLSFKNK